MSALISLGLAALLIVAAVWLAVVYMAGNAWYRSRVGRALVTLAGSIVFIEVYSFVRRLANWPSWTAQVEQVIILVALVVLCVSFHRERRRLRRGSHRDQP